LIEIGFFQGRKTKFAFPLYTVETETKFRLRFHCIQGKRKFRFSSLDFLWIFSEILIEIFSFLCKISYNSLKIRGNSIKLKLESEFSEKSPISSPWKRGKRLCDRVWTCTFWRVVISIKLCFENGEIIKLVLKVWNLMNN
jgi:hypothetical protein